MATPRRSTRVIEAGPRGTEADQARPAGADAAAGLGLARGLEAPGEVIVVSDAEFAELSAIAALAARQAGEALARHRQEWAVIAAELGREVKIDADERAEALILATLQTETGIPVLSEEAGWVGAAPQDGALAWAVDPLDGSVNYLRGSPLCAVSIGLLRGGEPVLGIVNCFLLGEIFEGRVGGGATLNGAPILVSGVTDPAKGVLQTGVPARGEEPLFVALLADLRAWRKVRMLGSAATALAQVACGRADAYRETGAMVWDVAGGCAVVRAAGGRSTWEGIALDQPMRVLASNGSVQTW